jgi:hypothetical protein
MDKFRVPAAKIALFCVLEPGLDNDTGTIFRKMWYFSLGIFYREIAGYPGRQQVNEPVRVHYLP